MRQWRTRLYRSLQTIRTVLALQIAAAFLVLMFCVSWIMNERLNSATEDMLVQQQTVLAANTAAQVRRSVRLRQQILEQVARSYPAALLADDAANLDFLRKQSVLLGVFDYIAVVDVDGINRVSIPDVGIKGRRVRPEAMQLLRDVVRQRRALLSHPYLSRTNMHIIAFAAPIQDARGTVVGVLGGTLNVGTKSSPQDNNLLGWVPAAPIGHAGYFYLLHRSDRRIIAHPDVTRVFTVAPLPGRNPLLDQALAGVDGGGRGTNSRGLDAIQSFSSIAEYDWLLGAVLPSAEAMAAVDGQVRELRLWIAAVALAGALAAWALLSRRLLPLLRLRRALAARHGSGGSWTPLPVQGMDEVAALTVGYNETMGAINHHLAARTAAEHSLLRLNRMYRMLIEINHVIIRERSLDRVLQQACTAITACGLFEMATVIRFGFEEGRGRLSIEASSGRADAYLQDALQIAVRADDTGVPALAAERSGTCQFCNDVVHDDLQPELRQTVLRHGFRSMASLPLQQRGKVVMVLRIFSDSPGFFDAGICALLQGLSEDISFALDFIAETSARQQAEAGLIAANAELEAHVARRTAQLQQANAELEAFSSTVSHDLRAPLRAIQDFTALLAGNCAAQVDQEGRVLLARVLDCAGHMNTMIDDLLLLSQIARYQLERKAVDLTAMARDIVGRLQSAEPARQVEVEIADGLVELADQRMVRHILENLLGNAWKFSAHVAVARISVERSGVCPGGFCVRDNGAGFDMRYADRLFQPFQRLHRRDEFAGTGVGLATVAKLVKRHGGSILAESMVGQGSCFHFTLAPPDGDVMV